jgi:hypothetical protein
MIVGVVMARIRAVDVRSRIEAEVFGNILRDNGIGHSVVCLEDSAFDGLFSGPMRWGFIEVEEADKDAALTLYGEYLESLRPDSTEADPAIGWREKFAGKVRTHDRVLFVALALMGIACVLAAGRAATLSGELKRVVKSMSVIYKWDAKNRVLIETSKRTGKITAKLYDLRGDGKYQKKETFAEDGMRMFEYFDEDENGIFERTMEYSVATGRLLQSVAYSNLNGTPETSKDYFANGSSIEWKYDPATLRFEEGRYTGPRNEVKEIDLPGGSIK